MVKIEMLSVHIASVGNSQLSVRKSQLRVPSFLTTRSWPTHSELVNETMRRLSSSCVVTGGVCWCGSLVWFSRWCQCSSGQLVWLGGLL